VVYMSYHGLNSLKLKCNLTSRCQFITKILLGLVVSAQVA
jgi:hypothetical protein